MEKGIAVDKPLIQLVSDLRTGGTYSAKALIERERRLVNQTRLRLKDRIKCGKPWLACPWCGVAVYLVQSAERRWFFRHVHEQDELCPHKTRGPLSQSEILAAKFNGQKEGRHHKEIKAKIYHTLAVDDDFPEVFQEMRWTGAAGWRQPDVQASWNHPTFGKLRIALEAQLSTTFIDVIAERRAFYRTEGGVLMWIFPYFDPSSARQFADDIRDNNNSNVFVIDQETLTKSDFERIAYVRCFYAVPRLVSGRIEDEWKSEVVPFAALKLNRARQQIYYFDYGEARSQLASAGKAQQIMVLRQSFEMFVRGSDGMISYADGAAYYSRLAEGFKQHGVHLPEFYEPSGPLFQTSRILLSAKYGHKIGLGFNKLIEVAHHADSFETGRHCMRPFGWLMKHHGTESKFLDDDTTGAWKARRARIRQAMEAGDSQYDLDAQLVPFMRFMFPELAQKLDHSFALQLERSRKTTATF
jgi:hypothetical protein